MFCIQVTGQTLQETSCDTPGALLVMTQQELQQHSPFYLDLESAALISGSLLMAMATAFVLRQARKMLEQR